MTEILEISDYKVEIICETLFSERVGTLYWKDAIRAYRVCRSIRPSIEKYINKVLPGARRSSTVHRLAICLFHVSCEKNNSLMDYPINRVRVCVRARINVCAFTLTSRVASEQKGIDYITRSRHAARWRYGDYVTAIRRVSKTRAHTTVYLPFLPPPVFPSRMFIMLQLFCDSDCLTVYTRCTNLCDRHRAV